jgi:hypothetical protein
MVWTSTPGMYADYKNNALIELYSSDTDQVWEQPPIYRRTLKGRMQLSNSYHVQANRNRSGFTPSRYGEQQFQIVAQRDRPILGTSNAGLG